MSEHLYHYTSAEAVAGIFREGLIRAHPSRLYRTMEMSDTPKLSPPLVWLTTNPIMEGTVAAKIKASGRPLVGGIHRVLIRRDFTDLSLPEWCEQTGWDIDDWACIVQTGMMGHSHYSTWRVVPSDVPISAAMGLERLAGVEPSGLTRWERVPLSTDWWPHLVAWAQSRDHRPLPARGALKQFREFCAARGFTGVPDGFAADAALRQQYETLKP